MVPCLDQAIDPMLDELGRLATSPTTHEAAGHFDALLRRVVRALCCTVGVARGAVYLTSDAMTFHWRACADGTPAHGARVPVEPLRADADPVTAELVRTRAPVVIADASTDACPPASVLRRFGVRDLIALPLLVGDHVIGAAYLDGARRTRPCAPHDLARAVSLARRAAALVRQGEVVLALRCRVDQARRDRDLLERSTRAQRRLDVTAIGGGSSTDLAAQAAQVLGRPVLLLGRDDELIHVAAEQSIAQALRATWRASAVGRHLDAGRHAGPHLHGPLPAFGLTSRLLVCPIIRGTRHDGALVALEIGRPFDELDAQVLERAAAVVRLTSSVPRRAAGSPRSDGSTSAFDEVATTAITEQVGFPAVLAWLDRPDDHVTAELLAVLLTPPDRRVLVPRGEGVVVAVRASSSDLLVTTLRRLLTHTASGRTAVVSRVALTPSGMAAACAELDAAATILEQNEVTGRVLSIDELGATRLLLAARAADSIAHIVAETLSPLAPRAIGAALSSALLDTVRSLVETDGSIREASRRLDVHENTVRHRIRRVRELTGLDPTSVGDLFQFHVAMCGSDHLGFDIA